VEWLKTEHLKQRAQGLQAGLAEADTRRAVYAPSATYNPQSAMYPASVSAFANPNVHGHQFTGSAYPTGPSTRAPL
jgi:cytolysin (calcineurin-like family phosphatase)